MNIRRILSTTAAGAALVLGVTACGGASDTTKNWFAAYCEGLQDVQEQSQNLTGADGLTALTETFSTLATNLKALPAPDVDGGADFAASQIAIFEAAADPTSADPSVIAGAGDMSALNDNKALRDALEDTPACSALAG